MMHLAGNPDLGPCRGEASCCACKHAVLVNGVSHEIPCDKLGMSALLSKMCSAKMQALEEKQSWLMVLILAAAWPTIVAASSEAFAELRSMLAQRMWSRFGGP